MVLALLIHVILEAEKAVSRGVEPKSRISNIVRKESLDMALRLYELFDLQRLVLMEQRDILHLLKPDIFPDPNPNAPLNKAASSKSAESPGMVSNQSKT
jgi:hypothetical protein